MSDYKNTVFLPQTNFPMRGNLPVKEKEILAFWQENKLYEQQKSARAGKKPFILHDGPPYANGNIHIGHAVNKILKDIVLRSRNLMGFYCPYVPGWDCHGLPIEWKIEEQYRQKKKDKDSVPLAEFRAECRNFAEEWVKIQAAEFQRLGVLADWENPYTTMNPQAEAVIVKEIHQFLEQGSLYRGLRPVLWSVVEKTALAEAEVEYHEHRSTSLWAAFPVISTDFPENTAALIWTTTPWTIPGNRAIAYSPEIAYGLYAASITEEDGTLRQRHLILAQPLAEQVTKDTGWALSLQRALKNEELQGLQCRHPLHQSGYDFIVPLLPAEFVTAEQGTGLVHIAPGHGEDDFYLGKANHIEVPQTVDEAGIYYPHVPLFAGIAVYLPNGKGGGANNAVLDALKQAGNHIHQQAFMHSYPHSWRSKAPLIFRTTPQWFIAMDGAGNIREKAMQAIAQTRFFPPQGRNRLEGMVSTRPDWCISRQRFWGVSLCFFVNKKSGEPLRDKKVLENIQTLIAKEGADAWFERPAADFLGNDYPEAEWEKVKDIVDVWFESGTTHAFVLEARDELSSPADLYLEGSDQHRGWFQSSLLESSGTRGRAPYRQLLTHGFVLDGDGRKMSKSLGNVVAPQKVSDEFGSDILRLWVAASDYQEDIRVSRDILLQQVETYRRFRNSLRYLLGALHGWQQHEVEIPYQQLPSLEKWVLHRVSELNKSLHDHAENYRFLAWLSELHHFCSVDLSAFYFDIRKDSLYCDSATSPKRQAVRQVMHILFDFISAWLSPILCFTAEEAWQEWRHIHPWLDLPISVHLREFPIIPEAWLNEQLADEWEKLRDVRKTATGALETQRAARIIGSSLQAAPVLCVEDADLVALLAQHDVAEICITSRMSVEHRLGAETAFRLPEIAGVAVEMAMAEGEKCGRCWKILPEVSEAGALCHRCEEAVA
ncbi:MAG: isoleucine--tRNA ligase [Alphaproteobacteria bacterium]